jgi:hypothetical protein
MCCVYYNPKILLGKVLANTDRIGKDLVLVVLFRTVVCECFVKAKFKCDFRWQHVYYIKYLIFTLLKFQKKVGGSLGSKIYNEQFLVWIFMEYFEVNMSFWK